MKTRKGLKIQPDIRKTRIYKYNRKNKLKIKMKKNNIEILNELIKRPLIKQRSPEWFKLREDKLTASDLYDAVNNPLSLAKKKLKGITFNSNLIPALKWGTMFEPMAIRIYSNMKNKRIHEFGLIINEEIENFGASPDGITEDGIMIEIKCPISRKIEDGNIPKKYYYQIQGQLAVCNLDKCDYIECEFVLYEDEDEYLKNIENKNNYSHGIIAEKKENNEYNYIYSSDKQDGKSNIEEMEKYINLDYKLNYWGLKLINIQSVDFDKNNWENNIVNKIKIFNEIYINEKKLLNPINLFIEEEN